MTSRRRFLQATAVSGVGAGFAHRANSAQHASNRVRRYAKLGRTNLEISDISFGSSRLRAGGERLVRHARDKGVNYFDTAESYTGGRAERVLGNALKGERSDVIIVSKTSVSAYDRKESIMEELEGSLRRLQTDYVDVYFNHAVNATERLDNDEWFEFVELAKAQGKLRFTGMSGHAGRIVECLDHALDKDMVDVVLIAHNFGHDPAFYEQFTRGIDRIANNPGVPRVLRRAKSMNVGVVAMKTLMGARLNDLRPYEQGDSTFAQAALRWALSNDFVDSANISMTSEAKIDEFLGASGWQQLAHGDKPLLDTYAKLNGTTYCQQACNDCEGACPYGVPISDVLRTRMYATDYEDLEFAKHEYALLDVNAHACLSCDGAPCRDACTHGLTVPDLCAPTHRMLA